MTAQTTTQDRPHCRTCGLRIELTARPGWAHLRTVAGVEADDNHLAAPKDSTPDRVRATLAARYGPGLPVTGAMTSAVVSALDRSTS